MLWVTGSSNYLWPSVIALIYILPLRLQARKAEPILKNPIVVMAYGVLGIIAGWTNENLTVALLAISGMYIFLYHKEFQNIPFYMALGFAGNLFGALALIAAPGNQARMEAESASIDIGSNLAHIVRRFFNADSLAYPCLILSMFKILLPNNTDKIWKIYFCGAMAAHFIMLFSPYYPMRPMLCVVIFLIIAIGNYFCQLDFSSAVCKKMLALIIIGLLIAIGNVHRDAYRDIRNCYDMSEQRLEFLYSLQQNGVTSTKINPMATQTRYPGASGNEYWCDRILVERIGLQVQQK